MTDSFSTNDGTLLPSAAAGPTWTSIGTNVKSRIEYDYEFDGADDGIQITTAGFGTTNGSILMWFNMREITNSTQYMFWHYNSGNRMYIGSRIGGTTRLRFTVEAASYDPTIAPSVGDWHHVAICWEATEYDVYWEGAYDSSFTQAINIVWGGTAYFATDAANFFDGGINHVRCYDTKLNAAAVAEIHTNTFHLNGVIEGGY